MSTDYLAAQWLLKQEQGLDQAGEIALQQWLAAHPSHQIAWTEMMDVDAMLNQLSSSQTNKLCRDVRAKLVTRSEPSFWSRCWQRLGNSLPSVAIASCAMVVLVCSLLWFDRQQADYQHTFATARGQFISQTLPDGSKVELDTGSKLHVALYRDRREVRLLHGQAMFHVSKDTEKPFHVLTNHARITVLGTQFAVRNINEQVNVAVKEGKVRVTAFNQREDQTSGTAILQAGDAINLAAGDLLAIKHIVPEAVASWRTGRLTFDNTTLADALAEFERYTPTGLSFATPSLAKLRISGSFEVSKLKQFTTALPQVLPVRVNSGQIESAAPPS
ncbi:FecR family protein [Iodobacter arcticus]|uniref:FecR family protein n=1 Tax=Iodobacter arcticus TaxID=590593 RepID=A0ABW2QYP9_9NEIS